MRKINLILVVISWSSMGFSQLVSETFNATRVINGHSPETLKKRYFEYRIEHLFNDFTGTNGGPENAFGFDNATDIRFAFEYGLSDKLMIGLGRCKGVNNYGYRSILDGFVKYRILQQKEKGCPLSITAVGGSIFSYAKAGTDVTSYQYYPKIAHRFAYSTEIVIARKFTQRLSVSLMPVWSHRNYTNADEYNDLFALGSGVSFKLSKTWALITEYYHNFHKFTEEQHHYDIFGFGAEWCTNGHSFHFFLTNNKAFNEAQFIAFNNRTWRDGQFRVGFSITRNFKR